MIKLIKSLKKHEVCELITDRIDKLLTNFANAYFDQYVLFKEGDKVSFLIAMAYVSKDEYFYQLKVGEKLAKVEELKSTAGNFFKIGKYAKAAKIY